MRLFGAAPDDSQRIREDSQDSLPSPSRERDETFALVQPLRAGVVGIYQRQDWSAEKRAALGAWARHILALAAGEEDGGNIVPLPPSRAAG